MGTVHGSGSQGQEFRESEPHAGHGAYFTKKSLKKPKEKPRVLTQVNYSGT